MIIITFINTNGYCDKRNAISFEEMGKMDLIKGVNHVLTDLHPCLQREALSLELSQTIKSYQSIVI